MRPLLPLAVPLLLAGCGGGGTPAPAPTPTVSANGYVAKVRALSDKQRAGVLLRAIRDAGRDCQAVVAQTPAGTQGASASWVATCDNQAHWVVQIGDDGAANVADAQEVARQQRR
jgi:hypothetical protein